MAVLPNILTPPRHRPRLVAEDLGAGPAPADLVRFLDHHGAPLPQGWPSMRVASLTLYHLTRDVFIDDVIVALARQEAGRG